MKIVVTMHVRGMPQADVEAWIATLVEVLERGHGAEIEAAVTQESDETDVDGAPQDDIDHMFRHFPDDPLPEVANVQIN